MKTTTAAEYPTKNDWRDDQWYKDFERACKKMEVDTTAWMMDTVGIENEARENYKRDAKIKSAIWMTASFATIVASSILAIVLHSCWWLFGWAIGIALWAPGLRWIPRTV